MHCKAKKENIIIPYARCLTLNFKEIPNKTEHTDKGLQIDNGFRYGDTLAGRDLFFYRGDECNEAKHKRSNRADSFLKITCLEEDSET